ncbi:hypothetical protein CYMTET_41645 [Cymbomonas tetramitiformis]|uniref:MOSC domain-containing protein n=1 Tax=Cymbomonas tetramitiformis TaxID=36881 RepID=A0AAE0F2A9_9CHLO|nr:hypothetical protein CYMTET_41645 [Cymbomonas tetramitiformis]
MTCTVSGIFIYPVKSCGGIELKEAFITPTGFTFDRTWQVVDSRGFFLTQRTVPQLALVDTGLPIEALQPGWGRLSPEAALVLNAPKMEALHVALNPRARRSKVDVCVWEWDGEAEDEGEDAARWFTQYLGMDCRLVQWCGKRPCDPAFAREHQTAFSDGFPFLLISDPTLEGLNRETGEEYSMARFRPNIVVQGCAPNAEDTWQTFSIGSGIDDSQTEGTTAANSVVFEVVKPCSRCKIVTIDQSTAVASTSAEPLVTICKYRSGRALGFTQRDWRNQGFFGWNLVSLTDPSPISGIKCGDVLRVHKKRTEQQF